MQDESNKRLMDQMPNTAVWLPCTHIEECPPGNYTLKTQAIQTPLASAPSEWQTIEVELEAHKSRIFFGNGNKCLLHAPVVLWDEEPTRWALVELDRETACGRWRLYVELAKVVMNSESEAIIKCMEA